MSETAKIVPTVLVEIPEAMYLDVVENGACAFHQGILDAWKLIDPSKSLRVHMAYRNIDTIHAQVREIEALKAANHILRCETGEEIERIKEAAKDNISQIEWELNKKDQEIDKLSEGLHRAVIEINELKNKLDDEERASIERFL